jgi:prepilin-type N-terminal cleavage/methylation domain-containing protein
VRQNLATIEPNEGQLPERTRSARNDAGFTLVEMLIAIVMVGLIASVLMTSLGTVIRSSKKSDSHARLEAVLSSVADRLTTTAFIPCARTTSYASAASSASGSIGWQPSTVVVTSVQYWNSSTNTFGSTCSASSVVNSIQKIRVVVTSPDGKSSRDLEVVKTDVVPRSR